jgi:hypothetical protein
MGDDIDGWTQNRKLIIRELERLGDDISGISDSVSKIRLEDIADLKTDIALLKLKSSLWGAVMGAATGVLVTAASILLRLVK